MPKKLNHNLVKIHRSYTVSETVSLFNIHKNTVLNWLKNDLKSIDDRKPILILGSTLKEFLKKRNILNRKPCEPEEMYCLKCRAPRIPAEKIVDYHPISNTTGRLKAICPSCNSIMNKYSSPSKLKKIRKKLDISIRN